MDENDRLTGAVAREDETIRRLKAELRAARLRRRLARNVETIEAFRALPFGGLDVNGR